MTLWYEALPVFAGRALRLYRAGNILLSDCRVSMLVESGNFLWNLPDASKCEQLQPLLANGCVRIERIISRGQATPCGEWYDQEQNEFVLLLNGEAAILIEGESVERSMASGDWIMLPAHCRHRVVWTASDAETVWLAVHWPTRKD